MLESQEIRIGDKPDDVKAIVEQGCPNFCRTLLLTICYATWTPMIYAIGYADDIVILLNGV